MRLVIALLCATAFAVSRARRADEQDHAQEIDACRQEGAAEPPLSRIQAEWKCPSELGIGVATARRFCDVLTGATPRKGCSSPFRRIAAPSRMSFELHNRHTYSAELVKLKQAYRKYTATIGVLTMDNTLVDRAVVQSEFRTEKDLFDRIGGGAGPGGVKAVAPSGDEFITIELPADCRRAGVDARREADGDAARRHRQLHQPRPADRQHQQRDAGVQARPAAEEGPAKKAGASEEGSS